RARTSRRSSEPLRHRAVRKSRQPWWQPPCGIVAELTDIPMTEQQPRGVASGAPHLLPRCLLPWWPIESVTLSPARSRLATVSPASTHQGPTLRNRKFVASPVEGSGFEPPYRRHSATHF